MIPFDRLFADGELTEYLESKAQDLWKDTYFEKYSYINNVSKGVFGELLVKKLMLDMGCSVAKRKNKGHDLIIDGYKTEVKFSLAQKLIENQFSLNHISFGKDWDRLIFFGVNYDLNETRAVFFKKKDLISFMEQNEKQNIVKHQQGGKKIKNDDYFVMNSFDELFKLPFVHDIYDWNENHDPGCILFWLK